MNTQIPTYALCGQRREAVEIDAIYLEPIYTAGRGHEGSPQPRRRTDLHQIIWITEGSIEAVLNEEKTRLHAPVLISVSSPVRAFRPGPGTIGVSLTLSQSYMDKVALPLEGMADSIKNWDYAIPGSVLAEHKHRIAEILDYIALEYSASRTHRRPALYGNTMLLLVEMARLLNLQRQSRQDASPIKSQVIFRNFKALIEAHFSDHWKISEYVAALSTNERTLRRACKAVAGLTPAEILQQRIISEAKRNLLYTDKTVSEICYGLGFADPSHFSKYFINSERVSPTVYRDRRQNRSLNLA